MRGECAVADHTEPAQRRTGDTVLRNVLLLGAAPYLSVRAPAAKRKRISFSKEHRKKDIAEVAAYNEPKTAEMLSIMLGERWPSCSLHSSRPAIRLPGRLWKFPRMNVTRSTYGEGGVNLIMASAMPPLGIGIFASVVRPKLMPAVGAHIVPRV
jgi:hypothetical protein